MTQQKIREIWYQQLAYDYSCTVEQIKSEKAVIVPKSYHSDRRIFRGDDCFLKILIVRGKLVVNADNQNFLKDNYGFFESADAAWFFEPGNIRALDKLLVKYGQEVVDVHHFYLPTGITLQSGKNPAEAVQTGKLHWYEKEDLEIFRKDMRFKEALSFIEASPDMLAVTWEEKGEIFGMAAASADCKNMWQIGINVLPKGEHRGLGTYLVTCLKEEILKRGKVPFYGTAESHIRSQRVAVQSGFLPAWAELYTKRM